VEAAGTTVTFTPVHLCLDVTPDPANVTPDPANVTPDPANVTPDPANVVVISSGIHWSKCVPLPWDWIRRRRRSSLMAT